MPKKKEFITSYMREATGHDAVEHQQMDRDAFVDHDAALKIEMRSVSELTPYAKNPRNNEPAVDAVAASIREFGFKVPIILDKDGVIVAGHTRLKAAKKLGLKEVPCLIADDLTPEQIKAFRLADNKVAELAEWDMDALNEEMEALTADFDMSEFGFELEEFEQEPEVVEDDGEPENVEPIVQPGQVWQLGDHRLMCGDSTKPEDVAKLMAGEQADMWLTDPPYNVAYKGKTKAALTIANDSMEDGQFRSFLIDAFKAATESVKPGGAFYIWHADSEGFNFRAACREAGIQVRQCLVWVKNTIVLGRQDYQWKREPCLYGWKDGAAHYFCDSRNIATVIEEDKPAASPEHPTMKPIKLFARQISNSSRAGEIVLDTFGGSGTTIMAAEQLNRKARLMEIDPHYCDVIIARWEKFTGQTATLVEGCGSNAE